MKRAVHAAAWVLLAITAFVLWPQPWGGSMTYVITTGNSMAPTWQAGDLAILRAADDYRVGDVAAFRSDEIDQIVMHRIRAEDDGVLRFQGDNNDFVDPDEVTEEDLLGRLLLRVPKVGVAVRWLMEPLHLALAVGGVLLLLTDRRERRPGPPTPAAQPVRRSPRTVDVLQVDVPPGTAVVDLVRADDIWELAADVGRPVLRDPQRGLLYLPDSGLLYRCPTTTPPLEDTRGSGRDWMYGQQGGQLPRPRRSPSQPLPVVVLSD